jgi:hypothetical protein
MEDDEADKGISYWQPRVMRHREGESGDQYAIHEVYFDDQDAVETYTEDALSPRMPSVSELKAFLVDCLKQDKEKFVMGDLQYTYEKEDLEFWLEFIDAASIDYDSTRDI